MGLDNFDPSFHATSAHDAQEEHKKQLFQQIMIHLPSSSVKKTGANVASPNARRGSVGAAQERREPQAAPVPKRRPVSQNNVSHRKPVHKQPVHKETPATQRPRKPVQNKTAPKPGRKRKQQFQMPTGLRFFGMVAVIILVLSGVITMIISAFSGPKEETVTPPASSQVQIEDPAQNNPQIAQQQAQGANIGPIAQDGIGTLVAMTGARIALPANGRVDMSYFDDALLIGDSLTQGFQVYSSGIPNAKYAAYMGVGPKQLLEGTVTNTSGESVVAMDAIVAAQPNKVYILLGSNSLENLEDEAFLKYYNELLDTLQTKLTAGTIYYIQGIPPVSATKSAENEKFSLTRITALNEQLAQIAYARGMYYLDLNTALADAQGALRADLQAGADGMHLNSAGYDIWREYLVTHAAYKNSNPYLPGSPLYVAPAA